MSKLKSHLKEGSIKGFLVISFRFIFLENKLVRFITSKKFFNNIYWAFYKITFVLITSLTYSVRKDNNLLFNPFEIIWVDPKKIKYQYRFDESTFVYGKRYGRVLEGEWNEKKPLEDLMAYNVLKDYLNDEEWSEINLEKLFEERSNKWCEDIETRQEEIENLIEDLRRNGYKSQKQLMEIDPKKTLEQCNDSIFPYLNEVQVCIDKRGEIYWVRNGKHRLLLSKLLDLEEIPVIVRFRHFEWIKLLERISGESKIKKKYADHPDVKYFFNSDY